MGGRGSASVSSGSLPSFESLERSLLNGSSDPSKSKSPLKQLTQSEFEEIKSLDISSGEYQDKTISISDLYSTQPENSMRRLETVYDRFKDDPQALYNNIVRPNEFMQAKPNLPIRVVRYNGKNVIVDGNHRIVILNALGRKRVKVQFLDKG